MTGDEIIALANKRGVTLEAFLGKLRVCSEGEPMARAMMGRIAFVTNFSGNTLGTFDLYNGTGARIASSPSRAPPSCVDRDPTFL
jgi:hypothetical protein